MKRLIYIAVLCLASLAVSCEDFLTVESPDKVTSGSFWRNATDAESGLAAAYSQLEYSIQTWDYSEVKWPLEAYREDVVVMGTDAVNYPEWVQLGNFSYTAGNSRITMYWNNQYMGLSFANQVIGRVSEIPEGNIDQTLRTQIINEAHFLRAYYHFKLMLNYENIVLRDRFIVDQEGLDKALSTRPEAWDFIIEDFKTATALPAKQSAEKLGRATSGAAYAYMGYAYLTRAWEEPAKKDEYLAEAVKAFDAVTGYELESDFPSMFDGSNKNSKESVFELQWTMNTANGANYRTQMHFWIASSELEGWDEILPSSFLMNEYMKEGEIASTGRYDSRLYDTVFFQCDYFNDPEAGRVYGYTYDEWYANEDFPNARSAFRKMLPPTLELLWADRSANNLPLMRYANVLLMKAEALNELGRTSEAIPLINQVRAAHGDMPAMTGTTKAEVFAQIEHERILEFPLENLRWYDLRRWGKLPEAMQAAGKTNFNMEKHAFYPVPTDEVNANGMID